MPPTPTEKTGAEIVERLKSFEGAASAFTDADETRALWIPEIVTSDFSVSPDSQGFFPASSPGRTHQTTPVEAL
jgi:hypothetical protein